MPCSPSRRITYGVARRAWRRIVPLWQHHRTGPLPRHLPARTHINWLAALDAINAGDNLPYQTSGKDTTSDFTGSIDDWRVAIAWGRMLIALTSGVNNSPPYPHPQPHAPHSSRLQPQPHAYHHHHRRLYLRPSSTPHTCATTHPRRVNRV